MLQKAKPRWTMAVSAAHLACPHSGTVLTAQKAQPATHSAYISTVTGWIPHHRPRTPTTEARSTPNGHRVLAGPMWILETRSGHEKLPA